MMGSAIVDRGDGPKGERLDIWDYTECNVHNVKVWLDLVHKIIRDLKKTKKRDDPEWIKTDRQTGVLYRNDPVTMFDGVKDKKVTLLAQNGITVVKDLLVLDGDDVKRIAKNTKGLGVKGLAALVAKAKDLMVDEDAPEIRYYLDEPNPFAAKYGTDKDEWGIEEWIKHVKVPGHRCVTDLVIHMAGKTRTIGAY